MGGKRQRLADPIEAADNVAGLVLIHLQAQSRQVASKFFRDGLLRSGGAVRCERAGRAW